MSYEEALYSAIDRFCDEMLFGAKANGAGVATTRSINLRHSRRLRLLVRQEIEKEQKRQARATGER
jgi:hypothetical protein